MRKSLITRVAVLVGLAAVASICPSAAQNSGATVGAPANGFSDNDWPSLLNRPVRAGNVLTWVGPQGGGANNGQPVQQSQTLGAPVAGRSISSPGTYTGLNLSDTLTITASNVTIRNSYIASGSFNVVMINAKGIENVVIEDCEIAGSGAPGGVAGQNGVFINNNIGSGGIIVRRNNIHAVGSGVASGDAPYQVTDNYIHDLDGDPSTHFNGIQDNGHSTHDGQPVLIQHNSINNNLKNQTDALMLDNLGSLTNVTVNNNKLLGANLSTAGVVYIDGSLGTAPVSVVFTNNVVGPNIYKSHVFVRAGKATPFTLSHSGNTSAATNLNIDRTF
jgi:hypothetical protein